jgi:hypothetical protein
MVIDKGNGEQICNAYTFKKGPYKIHIMFEITEIAMDSLSLSLHEEVYRMIFHADCMDDYEH